MDREKREKMEKLTYVLVVIGAVFGVVTFALNAHYIWHLFTMTSLAIASIPPSPTSISTFATVSCPSGFGYALSWDYTTLPLGISNQLSQQGTITCPDTFNDNPALSCNMSLYASCGQGCGMGNPYQCMYLSIHDPNGNNILCTGSLSGWSLLPKTYTYAIDPAVYPNSTSLWYISHFVINTCRQMLLNLSLTPTKTVYNSVEDISINVKVIPDIGSFSQSIALTASLSDISYPYSVLQTASAATDSSGNAVITFHGGFANGRISGTYPVVVSYTNPINSTVIMETTGVNIRNAINMVSSAESYVQYSNQPVISYVVVTDAQGAAVDPSQIQNLQSNSSGAGISSSNVTYLGNGKYKIISAVSTTGVYSAQISFLYNGVRFASSPLQIDIDISSVSIDVSKISPVANLEDTGTYTVSIFDSMGAILTPDNIYVDVRFPDGTQVAMIPMSQITPVSAGVYQFSFTFTQIEKYTFNVYAEKSGYAKGAAMASVAVNTPSASGTGIQGLTGYANWAILLAVLGVVAYYTRKWKWW